MKRPILIATIGYIIGIIWELYIQISIVPLFFILSIIFIILILNKNVILRYTKNSICIKIYEFFIRSKGIVIVILISSLISGIQVSLINNKFNTLYKDLEDIKVVATVVSEKVEKEYNYQYKIKVECVNNNYKYKNTNLFLNIKKSKNVKDLEYGDKIIFTGEYTEPTESRNYKGFNYKEYLKTIKVYGIIKPNTDVKVLNKNNANVIEILVQKLKYKIKENIKESLPNETRNLCLGILLGDTQSLSDEIKESFKSSSLYHILAVSGTHISYLIIGATFVIERSKISKRTGRIITIILLIFFMLLTGMTPSVFRAGVMGIILIGAGLFYKKLDIATSISLALLISLINNPFCIDNIGLQLSYGGTIGIVLFEKKIEKFLKVDKEGIVKNNNVNILVHKFFCYIKQMIAVSTSAQIIILPIMVLRFNIISFTFFISNILAGFIIGIIVICGYILIIGSLIFKNLTKCGFFIYNFILKIFLVLVEICSKIPFSKVYVITPNTLVVLFYYFLILGLRFGIIKNENLKKNYKKILCLLITIVLIFNLIKIVPGNLKIYFIDVGQGDSTLIVTPTNKTILIDSGGSKTQESYDVGENVLVPYLLNRGVSKLDYVLISHFDADHCNGIIAVLDKIKVNNIIISKQAEICNEYKTIISIVKKKNIPVQIVKKGDKIQFDRYVYMNILYPTEKLQFNDINNNSIVGKLVYGKVSILFTGDIEKEAENEILKQYIGTNALNSTILKVGHHRFKNFLNKRIYRSSKSKNCTNWSRRE